MPDFLLPTPLAPDESYASVSDILTCDDLAEVTIHVPFWNNAALRVRALDLETQDAIRMAAGRAVKPIDRERGIVQHSPTFAAETFQRGIVQPMFTKEQAQAIVRKHAKAVELVVNFVWALSAMSQEEIHAIVAAEAQIPAAEPAPDSGVDALPPADPAA